MSLETNIDNAVLNYFAGITLSCTDRLFSQNAKRNTQERLKGKLEQTEALNYLVETEQSGDKSEVESSREYHNAISKARNYFEEKGISFEKSMQMGVRGFVERVAEKFRHYKGHERINTLKAGKQLAVAYGLELVADSAVVVSRALAGVGHPVTALGHTIYQGFTLFLGMQTGKGILYVKDKLFRSKDEKELDKLARELTEDGKLLEILKNYSPTANLRVIEAKVIDAGTEEKQLTAETKVAYSEKAADLGERIGTTVADAAEGISKSVKAGISVIKQRLEQRKAQKAAEEEQKARELSNKYQKY